MGNNKFWIIFMNKTIKIIIIAIIIMLLAGIFRFFVGQKAFGNGQWHDNNHGGFPDTGDSARKSLFSEFRCWQNNLDLPVKQIRPILSRNDKNAISGRLIAARLPPFIWKEPPAYIYKINLDGTSKIRLSNATVPKSFTERSGLKGRIRWRCRYFGDPAARAISLKTKLFLGYRPLTESDQRPGSGAERIGSSGHCFRKCHLAGWGQNFYLNQIDNDLTEGVAADSNKNQKKIFELPFGEFNVS